MKRLSLLAALALAPAALAAQQPTADTVAMIDRVFSRFSNTTPGCALGVARNGEELLTRGYGMADLEHAAPITPNTIFEAGSVTKQFTTFLVLTLEQEGRLSIDDPLRKYLPQLPDYGAPLTIRQVLNHTSGLRDWYEIADAQGTPALLHWFENRDLLVMAARQKQLNFPSGTEYLYSNTGWNLLAIVVEKLAGQSFEEALRQRVLAPIGMTQTSVRADFRTIVPGRAVPYTMDSSGTRELRPFMNVYGAGGLLTTVHDLLLWNENLTTGHVGGRALVDRMQTRSRVQGGRQISYGLGLMIRENRGLREVYHSGSTGGYSSFVLRYPERQLSVALLCNDNGGTKNAAAAEQVAGIFLGSTGVQQAGIPLTVSEAAAMRGYFRNTRTLEPVELTLPENRPSLGSMRLSVVSRDASVATTLLGVSADNDSVTFERVARWTPAVAELKQFIGGWHSDEAAATWHTSVVGDTLFLVSPFQHRIPLRPAYRDAFSAPGLGTALFRRDARGRIVAVSFLMSRVRDLRLARQ